MLPLCLLAEPLTLTLCSLLFVLLVVYQWFFLALWKQNKILNHLLQVYWTERAEDICNLRLLYSASGSFHLKYTCWKSWARMAFNTCCDGAGAHSRKALASTNARTYACTRVWPSGLTGRHWRKLVLTCLFYRSAIIKYPSPGGAPNRENHLSPLTAS